MFKWFRRKPPEPYQQEYGAIYNARKHRWELCSSTAEVVGLFRIVMPTMMGRRQASLYREYDQFTEAIKNEVSYQKWLRTQSHHPQEPT